MPFRCSGRRIRSQRIFRLSSSTTIQIRHSSLGAVTFSNRTIVYIAVFNSVRMLFRVHQREWSVHLRCRLVLPDHHIRPILLGEGTAVNISSESYRTSTLVRVQRAKTKVQLNPYKIPPTAEQLPNQWLGFIQRIYVLSLIHI